MPRYRDFDAAAEAAGKEPVTFSIGGRDYELPSDLPAEVVLVQMRRAQDDGSVPQSAMYDWLQALVGEDNIDQMFADHVTWPQMEELLQFLMAEYKLQSEDEEDAEDGDSPNS